MKGANFYSLLSPFSRRLLPMAVVAMTLVSLAWIFEQHSWRFFEVKKVDIIGLHRQNSLSVEVIIEHHSRSGEARRVDVSSAHKQLLGLPWVKQLNIERHWPGVLSLKFDEYNPVARWRSCCSLAVNGGEVKVIEQKAEDIRLSLDSEVSTAEEIWSLYRDLERQMPAEASIVEVHESANRDLVVTLENGTRFLLGSRQREQKISLFGQILQRFDSSQWIHIDLRYPNGFAAVPVWAAHGKVVALSGERQ